MGIEEYKMIERLISNDVQEGNLEDLIDLRNFLNTQIKKLNNTEKIW